MFRSVILKGMTGEELQAYTAETQRDSDHLHAVVKQLRAENAGMAQEMRLLREALAVSQKEMGALKQQVSQLKLQRGYEAGAAGAGGNGNRVVFSRAALDLVGSSTPAAAAFVPTA